MYQALYRKWRPRTFDDVVGQDSVVETLKRQIVLGRPSHAYLFTGTRGTGKTTCAKIFARAVNCENPQKGNPCNKCPSCIGIENGSIMDVIEMDAASNNGVSDMRSLRDEAIYTPALVKKRVYIIDEVHMLSKDAFNALLKIMEEPPEHLMFILATTELHKVPATVLSRCQRYSFRRLPPSVIAERLELVASNENMNLAQEAAELLSRLADGSMRDGISLLDQCSSAADITANHVLEAIGLAGRTETEKLLRATQSGDSAAALAILDRLYCEGKDVSSVLEELCTLQRDILITKIAPKGGWSLQSGGYDAAMLKEMAAKLPAKRQMAALEIVQSALSEINKGSSRKIAAELCLMRLCGADAPEEGETQPVKAEPKAVPQPKPIAAAEPPEIAPMPEAQIPAPELKAEKAETSNPSGTWQDVLKALKPTMPPMDYMILSDQSQAEGEICDSTLTIRVKSPFGMGMLNKTEITSAVKAAAEKMLGCAVKVMLTDAQKTADGGVDKLDALSKFGNITFK
jgi:DNA polymerase-3 subunit gamma/tau